MRHRHPFSRQASHFMAFMAFIAGAGAAAFLAFFMAFIALGIVKNSLKEVTRKTVDLQSSEYKSKETDPTSSNLQHVKDWFENCKCILRPRIKYAKRSNISLTQIKKTVATKLQTMHAAIQPHHPSLDVKVYFLHGGSKD